MNISIAICSYNRADQLKKTLEFIFDSLDAFESGDELIVIDNNSNDSTSKVFSDFAQQCHGSELTVRYFFEAEQGLSAARNRALKEFETDYLIFFDDDISVTSNTIQNYRNAFKKYGGYSFFAGRILVDWSGRQPSWFKPDELMLIRGMVGFYDLGNEAVEYTTTSLLPYGANFALKRTLIDATGLFTTDLGVKGKDIGRGEESDYILRALHSEFKGLYVPQAVVAHRFQVQRINLRYLFRYGVAKGKSVESTHDVPWKINIASQLVKGIYQLLRLRTGYFYQCVINIGIAWSKRRVRGKG